MKHFNDSEAWKPKVVAIRLEIPAITTSTIHTDIDAKAINRVSLPLAVQQPIPPPVLVPLPSPTSPPILATVTAPLLSTVSLDIPQFQPLFLPLLQRLVSTAAADLTKLVVSTPPTTTMIRSPLLSASSASPDNLQFQSPFSSLLRCLVSATHQYTPTVVSLPGSLLTSAGTPFYYFIMLRCLHTVGHLIWFNTLATTRMHEFEPPPDKKNWFRF